MIGDIDIQKTDDWHYKVLVDGKEVEYCDRVYFSLRPDSLPEVTLGLAKCPRFTGDADIYFTFDTYTFDDNLRMMLNFLYWKDKNEYQLMLDTAKYFTKDEAEAERALKIMEDVCEWLTAK